MATALARLIRNRLVGGSLFLSFAILLVLLIGSAIVSFLNVRSVLRSDDEVDHTYEVLVTANGAAANLYAAESAARGLAAGGLPSFVAEYRTHRSEFERRLSELDQLTKDNSEQQARLKELRPLIASRFQTLDKAVALKLAGGAPSPDLRYQQMALAIRDRINGLLSSIRAHEDQLLAERGRASDRSESVAAVSFWVMTALGVLALIGFYAIVSRLIRTELALRQAEARRAAELENRVEQRTSDLVAANRDLESFSYSVSHDLRAPLRAVGSFARVLQEDAKENLSAENNETLDRIVDGCQRMSDLIDALLNLSRLSRADMTLREVDLGQLATEVFREITHAQTNRGVKVEIEPDLFAIGDESLIRVLLTNLGSNALKFSRQAAEPRILVGSANTEQGPAFVIQDNGVGFDPEHASELFEPFHRLHTTEEFPGTGIGLAICERIVRRHGGRIWAESQRGQGARFLFTLASPIEQLPRNGANEHSQVLDPTLR